MRTKGKVAWRSDSGSASELCHAAVCEDMTYPFHKSNSTVSPEYGLAYVSRSADHNELLTGYIGASCFHCYWNL